MFLFDILISSYKWPKKDFSLNQSFKERWNNRCWNYVLQLISGVVCIDKISIWNLFFLAKLSVKQKLCFFSSNAKLHTFKTKYVKSRSAKENRPSAAKSSIRLLSRVVVLSSYATKKKRTKKEENKKIMSDVRHHSSFDAFFYINSARRNSSDFKTVNPGVAPFTIGRHYYQIRSSIRIAVKRLTLI